MSRLKVLLRGAQISDLNLSPDREYVGGRKESCDIRLQPEKGISREHFKLKFEEGRWVLTSLSRFGEIFSVGQRVESTPLEHGQVFQIPPYEFILSDVPDSASDSVNASEMPEAGENERTVIGVAQQVPYIKMMSSDGQVREMLRLEVGDVWAAGRDPSCQIIIPDQRVSRRQFEVRKINGIYTIIDLTSVNGTFLNGSPISSTDPQPLKSGDAITVLDNTMYFELHDPNFQYRMERIEVPPMQMGGTGVDDVVEEVPLEEVPYEEEYDPNQDMNYPQEVDQGYYQDQLNPDGSPFTGMPPGQMQGDYYTMQGAEGVAPEQQGPPPSPLQQAWTRFKNNKPVFYSVVALFLVGMYFLSEMLNEPAPQKLTQQQAFNPDDPLSRLKPEERENISLWYNNAEKALRQQAFTIAKENLDNIHKLLPLGYKDSKLYEAEALNGEQTLLTQQETERRDKEQAELQALIKSTLEKCEKSIVPETTPEGLQECLAPVTINDPTNADAERMISKVRQTIADRQAKEDAERVAKQQREDMKAIFERAEKVHETGFPKKAIKAYNEVLESDLPDPDGYKDISKQRIKFIEKKLEERNQNNITNAETYLKDGKLKEGIMALRAALLFDPDNQTIKDKIERYSNDLRNQVKVMYQESIIDENFGYVDGSDNRPGAKDKWKKIIEIDLEDGDYYRKAFIKLRRYGVF
ncbi:MAG: FHA domain-containing protein [Pseudobdellovibrio sp.]|nr:FHA domain-containing protein [Pseudobdellovibrio sp.]